MQHARPWSFQLQTLNAFASRVLPIIQTSQDTMVVYFMQAGIILHKDHTSHIAGLGLARHQMSILVSILILPVNADLYAPVPCLLLVHRNILVTSWLQLPIQLPTFSMFRSKCMLYMLINRQVAKDSIVT